MAHSKICLLIQQALTALDGKQKTLLRIFLPRTA